MAISNTPAVQNDIDPLDRPLEIADLSAELTARGEPVSTDQLYYAIRKGRLAFRRNGKMTSTLRAWYSARSPQAPAGKGG